MVLGTFRYLVDGADEYGEGTVLHRHLGTTIVGPRKLEDPDKIVARVNPVVPMLTSSRDLERSLGGSRSPTGLIVTGEWA